MCSSFERAIAATDLAAMQKAWRQLGSPSLDGWTGVGESMEQSTAIDLLYYGFEEVLDVLGVDRDGIAAADPSKTENIDEIIAWLQGLGSRFTVCDTHWLHHYGVLEDMCGEGLDLTGTDLLQLQQHGLDDDLSLGATIFSSQHWGDPSALYPFLEAGAEMYPLNQPGASARSPPPMLARQLSNAAIQQLLRIFWPDTHPRKPDDQFVPVEDIYVQGICDFFAAKREKQRREEAWERRGLTLLCLLGKPQAAKAAKAAKTTKTAGQLVRDVFLLEPLLGRRIITFL